MSGASVKLLICFFVCESVFVLIRHFIRKEPHIAVSAVWLIVELVMAAAVAFFFVSFDSRITWRISTLECGLYIAFMGDWMMNLLNFVLRLFHKKGANIWLTFAFGALIFILGSVNAYSFKSVEHTFVSEKLSSAYRIGFISDLHYSKDVSEKKLEKMVTDMNRQKLDFVILGGDITDEMSEIADLNSVYLQLSKLQMPVYYIYGNHDRQEHAALLNGPTYSETQLVETITSQNITVLSDEFVSIAPDLVLFGREDCGNGRDAMLKRDVVNPYPGAFYLLAKHDPSDKDDIKQLSPDLTVSGHTHAAQLWPLRFFYILFDFPTVGEIKYDNDTVVISPGAGTWDVPFRTESFCDYEIIQLKPAG